MSGNNLQLNHQVTITMVQLVTANTLSNIEGEVLSISDMRIRTVSAQVFSYTSHKENISP